MDHVDWSWIRTFVAVLETGSLVGAARTLGASQPTVGRHLDGLEEALGLVLFERTRQGVLPTEAAMALLPVSQAMHAEAERFLRIATGRASSPQGTVRLTASKIVSQYVLPPILLSLQRAHPELQIELVPSDEIQNLLARDADVAIRMVRPTQKELVVRKVNDFGVGTYASCAYLEERTEEVSIENFDAHRWVGFDRNEAIIAAMRGFGLDKSREDFVARTDDQVLYARLVAEGAGIGFLAHATARQYPQLVPLLPDLDLPSLPIWVVTHRELKTSLRIRLVVDHLSEGLAAMDFGPTVAD